MTEIFEGSGYPEPIIVSSELLQAILSAVLRKYLPLDRKLELDLLKVYKDVYLDIHEVSPGKVKISWSEIDATLE